ncbi:hypothetical protein, partial [Comamonas kerstersii]|uniref:hypothetical protein n=1 Tax=Comamonas kerstersii TaxID=225992 RepID=UPI0026DB24A3
LGDCLTALVYFSNWHNATLRCLAAVEGKHDVPSMCASAFSNRQILQTLWLCHDQHAKRCAASAAAQDRAGWLGFVAKAVAGLCSAAGRTGCEHLADDAGFSLEGV